MPAMSNHPSRLAHLLAIPAPQNRTRWQDRQHYTTFKKKPWKDPALYSTYISWSNMRNRCRKPTRPEFSPWYDNIHICERWDRFENFLEDMGPRPAGKTLDRKENTGDYNKQNCRWATSTEQARNKTRTGPIPKTLSADGETMTRQEWCARLGVTRQTIRNWVNGIGFEAGVKRHMKASP